MIKFRLYIILIVVSLLVTGCDNKIDPERQPSKHTLLVYMAGDNNLSNDAIDNIDRMMKMVGTQSLNGGRLIVYLDSRDGDPTMFEIHKKSHGKAERTVLRQYESLNSASSEVLRSVLADMKALAPAPSYGLVLWSHGSGWLPKGSKYGYIDNYSTYAASFNRDNNADPAYALMQSGAIRDPYRIEPKTRAFGQDGSNWMELSDLTQALPDAMFDYILFDACFMGEAEVAYALRNKTKYLIASSAEILAEGMPYDLILSDCFSAKYLSVCEHYFNYYNAKNDDFRSATIALYDCSQMENLANAVKPIIDKFNAQIPKMETANIQRFDRNVNHTMFDMSNVVASLIENESDPLRVVFEEQLALTVVGKYNTEWMFNSFEVKTFCGMSMYIPRAKYADLNPDFFKTDWAKAIYSL